MIFGEMRLPTKDYIALNRVSSEHRKFIPITILPKEVIAGDKVYTVSGGSKFDYGILLSTMHMSWMRLTSGRLKSDYSYSTQLTYNNFPWPENISEKQRKEIENAGKKILEIRAEFTNSSLADLYDPLRIPPSLIKAHNELDKAVDLVYRSKPFTNEADRMVFLFELYEKYMKDLIVNENPPKAKKKNA